jgi:hypothetical protein
MRLKVRATELFIHNLRTRLPFRYGIATMTRAPHLIVRVTLEIDGRVQHGLSADLLPPKWFTKNPETPYRADVEDMLAVIRHACAEAEAAGTATSVFELWRMIHVEQKRWAMERDFPPLLWGFGVSLIERAIIDAFCRARRISFARAVRENALGFQPNVIYPELAGRNPAEFLPERPLQRLIVRHTVGLLDAVTDAEISDGEKLHDGLPQSLEATLRDEGITHLKIKLAGDRAGDHVRLQRISEILERTGRQFAFTLDGNENWKSVAPFREAWENLIADPLLARFFERLMFVEQPFHRDVALAPETTRDLRAWPQCPPLIIDESDGEPGTLALALDSGYAGGSHKNCKGVFKGLANACLIAHRGQIDPSQRLHLSAEDLCNIGPIALLQDLAVVATLGIPDVERNGHHYFAGLSQWPPAIQDLTLAAHGDLYHRHASGFPAVYIERGTIEVRSVLDAPFGVEPLLDPAIFTPADEWRFESLEL